MKGRLILGLLSLFMIFITSPCRERIDAGHEGIHKKIARDYTFAFREEHSIHYMQIVVNERYEY